MKSFHVKKNDEVVVLAGSDKGKRGRIISILAKKDRVIVEGLQKVRPGAIVVATEAAPAAAPTR